MTNFFDGLLAKIAALRERGVGGERLEEALDAFLPQDLGGDTMDVLRWLYVECEAGRSLARWALAELDAEVSELEAVGLAG